VLIIPSSWGSQLVGDLYINTVRIKLFSGAVAGERRRIISLVNWAPSDRTIEDAAGDVAAPCRCWGRRRLRVRRLATAENRKVEVVVLIYVLVVFILLPGLILVVGGVGLSRTQARSRSLSLR
jgi:hypothetical protein